VEEVVKPEFSYSQEKIGSGLTAFWRDSLSRGPSFATDADVKQQVHNLALIAQDRIGGRPGEAPTQGHPTDSGAASSTGRVPQRVRQHAGITSGTDGLLFVLQHRTAPPIAGEQYPYPSLPKAENSTQNLSGKLLLFRAMGINSQQRVVCIRKRQTLYASLGHSRRYW
jgi:hypothetical protein